MDKAKFRMPPHRLITVEAMRRMDAAAIAAGVPGIELMRRAGAAVAERAAKMVAAPSRILVLCGPGNNGGDGLIAARLLEGSGYAVDLVCTVPVESLTGDAALAAADWQGPVLSEADPVGAALVIDALFGAGLSRDLDGAARAMVEWVAAANVPVLAVDIPSGIDGDTGALRGVALRARETVTFVALKPGHLLQPGRDHCGHLHVADIGIGDAAIQEGWAGTPRVWRNGPDLWDCDFPRLDAVSHKYTRGHVLALSGPAFKTGAIRLAARAALRVGAGLVTIASPTAAMPENAAHLTAIMLTPCETADDLDDLLVDERLNVILAGPGMGSGEATRERVAVAAGVGRSLVLDADALTSFKGQVDQLASLIADGGGQAVLTPHSGEFGRLFADTDAVDPKASKLERALRAASVAGAVVVLKGADTIVAAPDGRAAINDHATPYLGTAGSGDVLGGLVAGLLAQGMPAFEAACAAVWLHGDAGLRHGPGLIAEDLPEMMPRVLAGLVK